MSSRPKWVKAHGMLQQNHLMETQAPTVTQGYSHPLKNLQSFQI